MAFTVTDRLGLPQWSQGSDGPSRTQLNDAFKRINDRAAYDDGAAGATGLPTSGVVDGRYAQTVDGPYRQLYRRAGGTWQAVGGNAWSEPVYNRADPAAATNGLARQISHPGIASPTAVENWDGSTLRGNRQAIGDLNSGQPGALHVGDTTAGVDLATRGRVFVRTTGDGQRGIVASAHGAGAGHLLAAQEPGGTIPWYVDAAGRMRAQAPAAYGAAALTAGVALASAPGNGDTSAADVYAASARWALRAFRAVGDGNPILSIGQDTISLGRSGWTGAQISLTAPSIGLNGNVNINGNLTLTGGNISSDNLPDDITFNSVVTNTLRTNSTTTLAATTAASLAATGAVTAHGGLVATVGSGSGAEIRTRPPTQFSGTSQQSVRAPMCYVRTVRNDIEIPTTTTEVQANVTMPEDGYMRLDLDLYFFGFVGAGGNETFKVLYRIDLLTTGGSLIDGSNLYAECAAVDSPERNKAGETMSHVTEVFPTRITAGSYVLAIRIVRHGVLSGKLLRSSYMITPVVLHSASLTAITADR